MAGHLQLRKTGVVSFAPSPENGVGFEQKEDYNVNLGCRVLKFFKP